MKKTILLMMVISMLAAACFPTGASEARAEEAKGGEMPAAFDLRNVDTDGDGVGDRCYVTPVGFQNPFGSCWAYAAVAAAETSLLGSVYEDDPDAWETLDLSEKQLAYFSRVPLDDPFSTQNGEGTGAVHPGNMEEIYGGGTTVVAAAAFAQGMGPSLEHPDTVDAGELFEYHGKEGTVIQVCVDGAFRNYCYSEEDDWTIPEELRFHHDYIVTDAHFLPWPAKRDSSDQYFYNESGTTAIKNELMEKRAVMVCLHADTTDPSNLTDGEGKYISSNWAHYAWDDGASDHVVTIIGWDDNYSKENFIAEHQPPADGAWLAKNSWGSGQEEFPSHGPGTWGIEDEEGRHTGYFWVSYYDRSLTDPISLELKIAEEPQNVDQLDYFLPAELYSTAYEKPVSMANVFKADHSKMIREISCMTASENSSVGYQIYLLQDAYQNPEDGLKVAEGKADFRYAGIHRIPVGGILVQKDQYYSVVVTLSNQDGTYDAIMTRSGGFTSVDIQTIVLNERESYLYQDGQWQDYKQTAEARKSEILEPGLEDDINLAFDNFPIKTYSDQAEYDVKMKLKHGDKKLAVLEGFDTDLYELRFTVSGGFDAGNAIIAWEKVPGAEEIAETEPRDQGAKLAVTAKAPGTAMYSVTAEGIGTSVFPITVIESGNIDFALVLAMNSTYSGEEITPKALVYSDNELLLTEGVHYELKYYDNIRCGLARVEVVGLGKLAKSEEGAEPVADYFSIVPEIPEIVSLSAKSGEIDLTVTDLSDTGADGSEVQYRMKGSEKWETASFGAGVTELVVSGLAAGEYEVQVCAFVDNTEASAPENYRTIARGKYGDINSINVP